MESVSSGKSKFLLNCKRLVCFVLRYLSALGLVEAQLKRHFIKVTLDVDFFRKKELCPCIFAISLFTIHF